MNLIEFDKENVSITYSPLLLTLKPFKKLIDRDKSKDKSLVKKELAFISFYTDDRSIYMYITNPEERKEELVKDLELPKTWKIDKDVEEAISLYKERSTTINSSLYRSACKAAIDVANYLETTDTLLEERDAHGKVVTDISKITNALEKVPKIMANLNIAHQELIKEQKITEGRSKGSREFNMYEDGLEYEDE
jgi:hypothetical protein